MKPVINFAKCTATKTHTIIQQWNKNIAGDDK